MMPVFLSCFVCVAVCFVFLCFFFRSCFGGLSWFASPVACKYLAALFTGFTLLEGLPIMDAASSDEELEVDPALEVSSEPECPNAQQDPPIPE